MLPPETLRAQDPRKPVLYLRSFYLDENPVITDVPSILSQTREQELVSKIEDTIGPVVAIGKPEEKGHLPTLGAARYYPPGETWREVVAGYLPGSALVVIDFGNTPALAEEIAVAAKVVRPDRLLFEFETPGLWCAFCNHATRYVPCELAHLGDDVAFLSFTAEWKPRVLGRRANSDPDYGGGLVDVGLDKYLRGIAQAEGVQTKTTWQSILRKVTRSV